MENPEKSWYEEWWFLIREPLTTIAAVGILLWSFFKVTLKNMFKQKREQKEKEE